jgi:alkylation response protein AidB-like acyl-CoA dehydrogenase
MPEGRPLHPRPTHLHLNGEKKWATSALSGLFTVMAREERPDGKGKIAAGLHPRDGRR